MRVLTSTIEHLISQLAERGPMQASTRNTDSPHDVGGTPSGATTSVTANKRSQNSTIEDNQDPSGNGESHPHHQQPNHRFPVDHLSPLVATASTVNAPIHVNVPASSTFRQSPASSDVALANPQSPDIYRTLPNFNVATFQMATEHTNPTDLGPWRDIFEAPISNVRAQRLHLELRLGEHDPRSNVVKSGIIPNDIAKELIRL